MDEQRLASQLFDSATANLEREHAAIELLTELKSGLMDDLLTGRVRVPPLLDREPAEAT